MGRSPGIAHLVPMLLALALGCAAGAPNPAARASDAPPAPSTEVPMAKPMTPHPRRHYVDGASLADTEALLRWLQTSDGRALRLPVAVTFDDDYRLAIQSARVGGIPLKLDDTAMSVALLEQVRAICADGEPGCTVWLEGTWGSVLQGATMPGMGGPDLSGPGSPPASGPIRHPFAVRKVGERIEHAPVFAQIEGPSMDRP